MTINTADLSAAITILWQSMLGIFLVMAVIAIVVFIFTKFTGKSNK